MPIYAYRCEDCGLAKDVLQKMSDDVLTICPDCGHSNFKKQITAAGFQLKGSGWYVTDFREGNKPAANNASASKSATESTTATENNKNTNTTTTTNADSGTTKATTTDNANNKSNNTSNNSSNSAAN
jgi:putative FmdB family regulatory protein